jgi:DNA-binding CsgD family transcriptional regulator
MRTGHGGTQVADSLEKIFAGAERQSRAAAGLASCRAAIDADFVVTAANQAFCWRFGAAAGRDCRTLFASDGGLLTQRLGAVAGKRPGRFRMRSRALSASGELLTVEVGAMSFRGSDALLLLVEPTKETLNRPGHPTSLTPAEAAILERLAAGETTTAIAPSMALSRQGVDYYVTSMLRSFQVQNRTALVAKAYHSGLMATAGWPPRVRHERIDASASEAIGS